jgi:hypothetical protein
MGLIFCRLTKSFEAGPLPPDGGDDFEDALEFAGPMHSTSFHYGRSGSKLVSC